MELGTNGRNVSAEQVDQQHDHAAGDKRRQVTRQAQAEAWPEDQRAEGDDANGRIANVDGRQRHYQRAHLL